MEELLKGYKEWLLTKCSPRTASSQCARVKRVAKGYDVLEEYVNDGCVSMLDDLTYTAVEKRRGEEPKAEIEIRGDYVAGLASLKATMQSFKQYLDEIAYKAPTKSSSGAFFRGSLSEFNRYVGPKARNEVQTFCKGERKKRKGVCEYCGNPATLASAHIKERPAMIKEILDRYFGKGGDLYEVDLPRFFDLFKKAHLPIREKIFFLCKTCHDRLDKTGDITPDDIRAVRGY